MDTMLYLVVYKVRLGYNLKYITTNDKTKLAIVIFMIKAFAGLQMKSFGEPSYSTNILALEN
jgi:hypothetical protein